MDTLPIFRKIDAEKESSANVTTDTANDAAGILAATPQANTDECSSTVPCTDALNKSTQRDSSLEDAKELLNDNNDCVIANVTENHRKDIEELLNDEGDWFIAHATQNQSNNQTKLLGDSSNTTLGTDGRSVMQRRNETTPSRRSEKHGNILAIRHRSTDSVKPAAPVK